MVLRHLASVVVLDRFGVFVSNDGFKVFRNLDHTGLVNFTGV